MGSVCQAGAGWGYANNCCMQTQRETTPSVGVVTNIVEMNVLLIVKTRFAVRTPHSPPQSPPSNSARPYAQTTGGRTPTNNRPALLLCSVRRVPEHQRCRFRLADPPPRLTYPASLALDASGLGRIDDALRPITTR